MGKFQFWLPTPDKLTRKQRRAIDSNNDIFLSGVPGSGKTVVSIYRLKNTKKGILFTYGKLLRKTIEEKVEDRSKQVVNIHRWLYDITDQQNYLETNLANENISHTISLLESKGVKFDEILVDEGQDLLPNSYKLFNALSKNISVSADEAQKVNNKDEASDEKDILAILPNLEKYELDEIFRSAYELYNFARQFVPYNARANSTNILERLKLKNSGADKPFIYLVKDSYSSYKIMRDIIDDNPTDNIGILCGDIASVKECSANLQSDYDVSSYHSYLSKAEQKNLLENSLNNIIITTLKSAKGIEFDIVIIHEVQNAETKNTEEYFVGVTRAKSQVYLISVREIPAIIKRFDKSTYNLIDETR
jgi:superfamily I DNA/RNA helicase